MVEQSVSNPQLPLHKNLFIEVSSETDLGRVAESFEFSKEFVVKVVLRGDPFDMSACVYLVLSTIEPTQQQLVFAAQAILNCFRTGLQFALFAY